MTDTAAAPQPRPEPLFTLDLKDNGGFFAPINLAEITTWVQKESTFWEWVLSANRGNHEQSLRHAVKQLAQAEHTVNQAAQYKGSNPQQYQNHLQTIEGHLHEAFLRQRLPHSSTPLAQRIAAYKDAVGDQAASFFAAVFVPPQQGNQFQPNGLLSWRGLVEGLIDRYGLNDAPQVGREQAAEQSFEQLRVKAESLLGDRTTSFDTLHRDYSTLAESVRSTASEQKTKFEEAQTLRASTFDELVSKHEGEMEALRKTFREEMALRAPATYWETKRQSHERMTKITGGLSFGGIAVAAIVMGWLIHDLLRSVAPNTPPEAWRIAMLVLVGIFTVWGLRLVVRMFLSHLHLATDAAERVVMTHTYLSLMEGDQLTSKEDRQLILQALFRPASDGIVKDEGVPFSLAEVLTRTGKP